MEKVRVSIANLAWFAVDVEGKRSMFGVLNPNKLRENKKQYQALGGGAMLNGAGQIVLQEVFAASDFERDEETGYYDARFQLPEENIEKVFSMFEKPGELEHDPTLDIIHELRTYSPRLLSPTDAAVVHPFFLRSVRQGVAEVGGDTSVRGSASMPTYRLFRLYELWMPRRVFESLKSSEAVRFLTEDELRTTDGGRVMGRTSDGLSIQNNLFLV